MSDVYPDASDPRAELERIGQVDAEKEALELRLKHWSYPDIADIQGVSIPTVRARIERAIQYRLPQETRRQMRQMEGTRLDRHQPLNQLIIDSASTTMSEKQKAVEVMLRVMDRRARLFGLDAPAKLDVQYSSTMDNEIELLMNQLIPGTPEPTAPGETGVPWEAPER